MEAAADKPATIRVLVNRDGSNGGTADPDEARSRPRAQAQLRAALALEEAGELQEAARMFEYVGEHAQAASLRLEHADTLRDERQRLAVLREGCARIPADSAQSKALHRALGEALLSVVEGVEPGVRRRALLLEAAAALEAGERGGEAGRLYEGLGLLSRAARAYTAAGEIDRLEAIHQILERREQAERARDSLAREIEAAASTGRRAVARQMILDHIAESERDGSRPIPALTQLLHELDRRALRGRMLTLAVRRTAPDPQTWQVRLVGRPRLRLGRGPQCELPVSGTALSREHTELALAVDEDGRPALILRDLGSKAGSFVDGEALVPGEDWPWPEGIEQLELALGVATSFDVIQASATAHPVTLLRDLATDGPADALARAWTAFAPLGGVLWLEPGVHLPAVLTYDGDQPELQAASSVQVTLDGTPLGPGAAIELLAHDRITLSDGARELTVEVREHRP